MPLEDIKAVLRATDPAVRTEVIVMHLDRMQLQLSQIQGTVASLRALGALPEVRLDTDAPPVRR